MDVNGVYKSDLSGGGPRCRKNMDTPSRRNVSIFTDTKVISLEKDRKGIVISTGWEF